MFSVEINGNTVPEDIHASSAARVASSAFRAPDPYATEVPDVADTNYILIEVKDAALTAEQKDELKKVNVDLLEYKGKNVYLCGYTPPTLDAVTDLTFIEGAAAYDPRYVIHADLKDGDVDEEADVILTLHDNIKRQADLDKAVDEISSVLGIAPSEVDVGGGEAKVSVPKSKLAKLAEVDSVKGIAEYAEPRLYNSVAGRIMEVHKPVGLHNRVYKGKGQVVCVADTGFDTGLQYDVHPAFMKRVKQIQAFGGEENKHDFDGHGTHVAGSVLGKGKCDPQRQKFQDGQDIEGPASEAELIFQAVSNGWSASSQRDKNGEPTDMTEWSASLGGIPAAFKGLGDPAYEKDARIHTNSWGASSSGRTKYKPGLVVLFAASNDGVDVDRNPGHVDPSSRSYQACAKNVITVGASESQRGDVTYSHDNGAYGRRVWGDWADFPSAPISAGDVANNPEGLAAWSSRGPAWVSTRRDKGRIKPDVVAPGTTILSARSRAIDPMHYHDPWGKCDDPAWMFSGGTSMATPLVAGCCAVIRGALVDPTTEKSASAVMAPGEPSAALIKAILINGAVAMKGQYNQQTDLPNGEFGADYDRPNSNYGFGRVNLDHSLQHIVPGTKGMIASFGDITGSNAIGDDTGFKPKYPFTIKVPESTAKQTLKVTLHGNMPDGSKEFDEVNNVEQVKWKNVQPGEYKVTIVAMRTIKPQSFAYAWRVYQD
ncbi:peptidase S8/S53 domain-containing protein [Podospora aff. communis PSN243]|uniref:Peptidase S8/S53 domain-containing protein n=1 Tax=Podospora aff. communis PSN243 TaxID=3040156 RepID=A0AAV9G840_9PEZI|nr:peptidase S8/S53 domain-containing protein [Podospora aff. communis PSN243]